MGSDRPWSDIRDLTAYRKTQALQPQIAQSPQVLVQATFWHRNAQVKIELIADKSSSAMQPSLTCAVISPSS